MQPYGWDRSVEQVRDLLDRTRMDYNRKRTAYDQVVSALGGAGESITDPRQIGPALDRAFAANAPYLVNVITDVDAAYPRSTFGI